MAETSQSPQPGPSGGRIAGDLFAGAGMGLLIGVTVGLSTTPVVAIVVGALTSLLAVFLGLGGGESSPKVLAQINTLRIGALGFATVVGLLGGLYVRINNPIAEDPSAQIARWAEALPDDPTLAKQMMVYERTGIAPAAFTFGTQAPTAPVGAEVQAGAAAKSAVLFSTLGDYDACTRLNPARFGDDPEAALQAYDSANAPPFFAQVKTAIEARPLRERAAALAVTHEVLCIIQSHEAQK